MVSYLDPEEQPGGIQTELVEQSRTPDVGPSTPSHQRHAAVRWAQTSDSVTEIG